MGHAVSYITAVGAQMSAAPVEPVQVLRSSYLFQDLSPVQLEPLVRRLTIHSYGPGQYIYRVGERAHSLYVLASGQVAELLGTAEGEELVYDLYTAGAVFGEPALFAPERTRVVDTLAMAPSVALAIARELLLTFLHDQPAAMLRMLEGLATDLRLLVEQVATSAYLRIRERLAAKLLTLAASHGVPGPTGTWIDLDLSQSTLAAMIGATRENVNRALGRLAADGYLHHDGKHFVITDSTGLGKSAITNPQPLHQRNQRTTHC